MDTYHSQFGAGQPTGGKEQTEDGFYPSLKADFQATDNTALYAAVSRSYRTAMPMRLLLVGAVRVRGKFCIETRIRMGI